MAKQVLPKKLRICFVARRFPILGRAAVHGFLWPIAKGLAAEGHSVTVLSLHSPLSQHHIERNGVNAYFLYEGVKRYLPLKPQDAIHLKFLELHKEHPFDIVHAIDDLAFEISREKSRLKVAVAYDIEATHLSALFSLMGLSGDSPLHQLTTGAQVAFLYLSTFFKRDRRLLKSADGMFVTSPQQRLALERYYLYPDAKIHMVPYGIELSDEPKDGSTLDQLRSQLELPEGSDVALCLSDFTELSEIKNLLLAFQSVAIKKPKSRLLIVGDGPHFKTAEYEVLSLALGKKVKLVAGVSNTEISDYIALSHILVNLSSRTTGFEPSLLEAMSQAKVIIGSEISPISTIVEDGVHGFLIRPADTDSLSTLLLDVFDRRIDADSIGRAASLAVHKLFDMQSLIHKTIEAYRKTLVKAGRYQTDARSRPFDWVWDFNA